MFVTNGNGWRQLQWTVAGAVILACLAAGVAGWRQFTLLQERMEYLLNLNAQQTILFESLKDGIRSLQQQSALQGQTDSAQRERLQEQDAWLKEIGRRLREVEQRQP